MAARSSFVNSWSAFTYPLVTSLSWDLTVSSLISGFFLNRASWDLRTLSATNRLGFRAVAGFSMKGSLATSLLFSTSNSTLDSIWACSASSLKLISSRTSAFLHFWQQRQLSHLYGESAPTPSVCQNSLSAVFTDFSLQSMASL